METIAKYVQLTTFLAFLGELFLRGLKSLLLPARIQWRALFVSLEQTGYRSLPIVGLLSFLIGVVLAYQTGLQLKPYGANIFIVDLSGMAILREFAPLITAIILAGRTTSAFTAEIGMMKINQEVDALTTMGLSPIRRLVLPKIGATLIALPLLIMWADMFGIFGSMFMSDSMLNISYTNYILRFHQVIEAKSLYMGLVKAPVFGLLIAGVGCFQGFQVSASAASVGSKTTKSVVQAIFLIILADAGFSVLFRYLGL